MNRPTADGPHQPKPMRRGHPLALLLATEHAEETKQATLSLRRFYPGCRIEAVYSSEEALEWASRQPWDVILLDECLRTPAEGEVLPAIRERAPHAAIIVQTDLLDAATTLQLLRAGADFYVHKQSPTVYDELPVVTRHVLETRELRDRLELALERYRRLTEQVSDLVYQLDPEGRVAEVSPGLAILLGYQPDEVVGKSYLDLIDPEDRPVAEGRLNERRTGKRVGRPVTVHLRPKESTTGTGLVPTVEVTALGLYNPRQEFLGTLGIVHLVAMKGRPPSRPKPDVGEATAVPPKPVPATGAPTSREIEPPSVRPVPAPELAPSAARPSVHVSAPSAPTGKILRVARDRPGATPAPPSTPSGGRVVALAVNQIIQDVLASKSRDLQGHATLVDQRLAPTLPTVRGDRAQLQALLAALVTEAEQVMWQTAQGGCLRLVSRQPSPHELQASRPLPATPEDMSYILVEVTPPGRAVPEESREAADESSPWARWHRIAAEHGGTLTIDGPPTVILRARLRLPGSQPPPPHQPDAPERTRATPPPVPVEAEPPHPAPQSRPRPPRAPDTRQERRRSVRRSLDVKSRLTMQNAAWGGVVSNMSLHGLYLLTEPDLPIVVGQPVQVGFASEIGLLDLPGRVTAYRAVPDARAGRQAAWGLAIEFEQLTPEELQLIASLLESVRDHTVSVQLTVALLALEPGELLLDAMTSGEAEPDSMLESAPSPPLESDAMVERRLTARVTLSMPAWMESAGPAPSGGRLTGTTANLSLDGACLRLNTADELLGHRVEVGFSPPPGLAAPSEGGATPRTCAVTAQVVWTQRESDPGLRATFSPQAASVRAGLRFLSITDDVHRQLTDLLSRALTSATRLEGWAATTALSSGLHECRTPTGQRIALYHDHPRQPLPPGAPLALICPGYGETKKDYVSLGYTLAGNGFQTLRFDYTNHVGESDGDPHASTLRSMEADVLQVLTYAASTWPTSPIIVIATGLAARVVLKAVGRDPRVRRLILITPVVDLQATLTRVHQEDLVRSYLEGTRRGTANVLGLNIDLDRFLEDALEGHYADLPSTLEDARILNIPVSWLASEQDPWNHDETVQLVQETLEPHLRQVLTISVPAPRLQEHPRRAQTVLEQLVRCCREACAPLSGSDAVEEPASREIALQLRLETERGRLRSQRTRTQQSEFWEAHQDHFRDIVNVSEYWQLLDHIARLMGTCERGELILDAGCGSGHFGMFLMVHHAYRRQQAARADAKPPVYVGADRLPALLYQARTNLCAVAAGSVRPTPGQDRSDAGLLPHFLCLDLDHPLPFRDNRFDRVVCNLVLGHLRNPLFTLRELTRVLSPHGRLVLTTFKPQADLTVLARALVAHPTHPEGLARGRQLMRGWGELVQDQIEGRIRSFDRQQLTQLLVSSGATHPRVYPSLANQALVVVAEKHGLSRPDARSIEH